MYYLFTWDQYCPSGGFNDFHRKSMSLDEIKDGLLEFMKEQGLNRYQIVQITKAFSDSDWNVVEESNVSKL